MGFCKLEDKDGIFIVTLGGSERGHTHNCLNEQSLKDLEEVLKDILDNRIRMSSKGLVTTSIGELFCDGVDYSKTSTLMAVELAHRMAKVVAQLFQMPFPTVAAITGDVKSSLALALVLAHDEMASMKEVKYEVKEVQGGFTCMPPYLAALLRDKVPFPRMTTSMVLRSETMTGKDLSYWELFDPSIDKKEGGGVEVASRVITHSFCDVHDGKDYITTRTSFFPESWKAVCDFLRDNQ